MKAHKVFSSCFSRQGSKLLSSSNLLHNESFYRQKKWLVVLMGWVFFFMPIPNSQAQTLELGAIVGGSNYQGDLASSEFAVLQEQLNVAFGGFLRYNFNDQLSIKLQILSTDLDADDTRSSSQVLQQRNLRFFTPLLDASLRLEWHPLATFFGSQGVISPYFSGGGSFFTFNPQTTYNGRIFELQPLRTEGQGLMAYPERPRYELYNFSALLGVGIAFRLNDDLKIAIELSGHGTFTDYLDDVSTTYVDYNSLLFEVGIEAADIAYQTDDFFQTEQSSPLPGTPRGNPNSNDFFFVGGITLSYAIINPNRLGGRRGQIGCPTF